MSRKARILRLRRMFSVRKAEGKGAGVFSNSNLRAGQTVLAEDAFEAVLNADTADSRSHWTFKPSAQLQRCVGCKFARYANKKEQKLAWRHGHKEECLALQKQGKRLPGSSVRLVARILWKRAQSSNNSDFEGVRSLVSHWDDLADTQRLTFAHVANAVRLYMSPEGQAEQTASVKEIAMLLSMLSCNSHTICNEEEHPIGIGLFKAGALINHSCKPNAVQVFQGKAIQFRALRDLRAGEEVTIAYIELGQTRQERRTELLRRYHFDINKGYPMQEQQPLGEQRIPAFRSHSLCQVWQECPHLQDEVDRQLTEVLSATGGREVHSGFTMAAPEEQGLDVDQDSFFSGQESEEGLTEEHMPAASSRASDCSPPAQTTGQSKEQDLPIMHFWGPAFLEDGAIKWDVVKRLGSTALQWWSGCKKANEACQELQPFSLADLDHEMGGQADQRVSFGPLHIIRARLDEVKFRIAQETGQWEEALECGLRLRAYYNLVHPEAFPLRGLHEAAIAKIADLMLQPQIAAQSAREAIGILTLIRPEAPCLNDLLQIRHNLLHRG